jgi:hypothetical protein
MSSAATRIRDAMFDLIKETGWYKDHQKAPVPQRQPSELPACAVFRLSETMSADGDANAGHPQFMSEIVIAVSIVRGFDDPEVLEGQAEVDADAVEKLLLCDQVFTRTGADCLFEALTQVTRRNYFPAKDGETYFVELRLEFTFQRAVDFEPTFDTPFNEVRMTTRPVPSTPSTPRITTNIAVPQD